MGDEINNIQIENFFEKEENEDLKNNFVGVFSIDYITRYIKFHELIREKKGKISICNNKTLIIKQECIGGVF